MIWNPRTMYLYEVYSPFGGLEKAGLKRIGKERGRLILTFVDGTEKVINPGEQIPLPYHQLIDESAVYGNDCPRGACDV